MDLEASRLKLDEIFSKNQLGAHDIYLCRQDGIFIYSKNSEKENALKNSSVGALIAGVWQASSTLSSFVSMENAELLDYRLSFDRSNAGVYIYPLSLNDEVFTISILYKNELNPGKLKMYFRKAAIEASELIKSNSGKDISEDDLKNNKDFLFDSISDTEMDQLFPF